MTAAAITSVLATLDHQVEQIARDILDEARVDTTGSGAQLLAQVEDSAGAEALRAYLRGLLRAAVACAFHQATDDAAGRNGLEALALAYPPLRWVGNHLLATVALDDINPRLAQEADLAHQAALRLRLWVPGRL